MLAWKRVLVGKSCSSAVRSVAVVPPPPPLTYRGRPRLQQCASIATSTQPCCMPLDEFRDSVSRTKRLAEKVGRSWTVRELRRKSFQDLHKLWYVLYKERNMLRTEKQLCRRRTIEMPQPERLHKVKKSMGAIKQVLGERKRDKIAAFALKQLHDSEVDEGDDEVEEEISEVKEEEFKVMKAETEVKDDQSEAKEAETEVKDDQSELQEAEAEARNDQSEVKQEETEEKEDQSEVKEGGSELNEGGSELNEEGSALTEEGSELKEETSELKEERSELKEEGSEEEEGSEFKDEGSEVKEEASEVKEEASEVKEEASVQKEESVQKQT